MGWVVDVGEGPGGWYAPAEGLGVVGGPGGGRSARRECGEPATTRDHGVCTEETLEPGVSTVKIEAADVEIEAAEDGGTKGTDADGDACVSSRTALSSVGVVE